MPTRPKVSIISITYNQEKYIRDTLEGFVKQKTDFDVEVIIADDHSKDGTPAIIKEYAQAHPDIFKPIYRPKNFGPWQNFTDALKRATGEYVTICEGDDYWTDSQKLQKQADFLDASPDYALCFHAVQVKFEDHSQKDYVFPDRKKGFTLEALLTENFIQTNSVMYRRQNYDKLATDIMPGDWYLHAYHAQFGKIGFIDRVMSVYRVHAGGIWWSARGDRVEFWEKYGLAHLNFYSELLALYGKKPAYRKVLEKHLSDTLLQLAVLDQKNDTDLASRAAASFPAAAQLLIMTQQQTIQQREQSINELQAQQREIKQHADNLQAQLNGILASKAYKLSRKASSLKHQIKPGRKRTD